MKKGLCSLMSQLLGASRAWVDKRHFRQVRLLRSLLLVVVLCVCFVGWSLPNLSMLSVMTAAGNTTEVKPVRGPRIYNDSANGRKRIYKHDALDGSRRLAEAKARKETRVLKTAESITYTDEQGVIYTLEENAQTYTVTGYTIGYTDELSGITIASVVNGLPVTAIGESAFLYCTTLTSIILPNSIVSISEFAFQNCDGLASVTLSNSLKTIGAYAFSYCNALTSITIPNSVTEIGSYAFWNSRALTSIIIPSSVTSIGYNVFSDCSGLASIVVEEGNTEYDSRNNCNAIISTATNDLIAGCKNTVIPNSVVSIGSYAFEGCYGLSSVSIHRNIKSIGIGVFKGCTGLASIVVESGNTIFDSRDNCNAIINTATNSLVAGCKNTVIPNSVTSIDFDAFAGNTGLTSIVIPSSVTKIDGNAFYGCI